MPLVGAVLCAAITGFLLPRGMSPARRRLRALPRSGGARGQPRPAAGATDRRAVLARRAAAALAGITCAVLIGGPFGMVAGVVITVICLRVLGRLEPRDSRRRRAALLAELPVAVDLLVACMRGGSSWYEAVSAVADAVGGPLADELRGVAARVRLGEDPATAWLGLASAEPALAPLAHAVARAAASGSALAVTLERLARDQRRAARAAALARARTAGIHAVAPLGLCFLPAFVLLGVIPAVAGIASSILLPW